MQQAPARFLSSVVSTISIATSLLALNELRKGLKEGAAVGARMRANAQAGRVWPRVAVLVPARNEEATIGACITSILAQDYPAVEVIAIDDGSTDGTAAVLADLQHHHPDLLRVVPVTTPPGSGWTGKTHALWHGYANISPDVPWLLFVDADVTLKQGAMRAAVGYAQTQGLDLLSLVPTAQMRDFWSRLLIPLLARFYLLAHVNPLRPAARGSPEEAAAIGQFILVRHAAYRASGGHYAVRGSVAEDIALARQFRTHGRTTLMINGQDFADVDGYQGLGDLWEGITKNLFVVARGRWSTMASVLAIEWLSGLIPAMLMALPKRQRGQFSVWLNRLAVALVALSYGRYLRALNVPLRYVALYPLSAVLSSLIFLDSARVVRLRGAVKWKGRTINMREVINDDAGEAPHQAAS